MFRALCSKPRIADIAAYCCCITVTCCVRLLVAQHQVIKECLARWFEGGPGTLEHQGIAVNIRGDTVGISGGGSWDGGHLKEAAAAQEQLMLVCEAQNMYNAYSGCRQCLQQEQASHQLL
jgi:hypothetical protein